MKTRSQTTREMSKIMYEVVINFDEASNEWKSNKKSLEKKSSLYSD